MAEIQSELTPPPPPSRVQGLRFLKHPKIKPLIKPNPKQDSENGRLIGQNSLWIYYT